MPVYDTELFDPPAPLARVTLRNPENGTVLPDVLMLLDSGADVTLIPQACVEPLGAAVIPDKYYELEGFDGKSCLVRAMVTAAATKAARSRPDRW